MRPLVALLASAALLCGAAATVPAEPGPPLAAHQRALDLATLRRGFATPPVAARPWVKWFWYKNDVTAGELRRELGEMARAGLGGAEIRIIDDPLVVGPVRPRRTMKYLDERWLDALEAAAAEAERLGLRLAVNFGMGWRYGGPWIPRSLGAAGLVTRSVVVEGPVGIEGPWPLLADLNPAELAEVEVLAWPLASNEPEPGRVEVEGFIDLSGRLERDGRFELAWRVPPGRWLIGAFLVYRHCTVKHVEPDSGGAGLSLDPWSRDAVRLQLREVGERIRARLGRRFGTTVTELATDSWEYRECSVNWSTELLTGFPDRAGYDLRSRLHALLGHGPDRERVLADLERVGSALLAENFFAEITRWCERAGIAHRAQPYGTPEKNLFAAYREVTIPEVEGPEPREAAWVAHTCGKPLVAAEAFTFLGDATPARIRAKANELFAAGVNRLDLHSWSYSPPEAGSPGWQMYVPIHVNRNSALWPQVPRLFAWMARSQWLLQAGRPVADAVGLGTGPKAAYGGFDRVDSNTLPCLAEAGSGQRYEFGLLAVAAGSVTREDAEIVAGLLDAGVEIYADQPPGRWPALAGGSFRQQLLARKLEQAATEGRLCVEPRIWERVREGAPLRPVPPDLPLRYLERRVAGARLYLLVNPSTTPVSGAVRIRHRGPAPELWDPETGAIADARAVEVGASTVEVPIELGPGEGRFLVLPEPASRAATR